MRFYLVIFLSVVFIDVLYSQETIPSRIDEAPYLFRKQFLSLIDDDKFENYQQQRRHSRSDWANAIDETWGNGLPVSEKLQIFETFWNTVDWYFACFQDLNVDWDSLRSAYRDEILDTVSRGRFAAIMTHLSLALKEAHTNCEDSYVCHNSAPSPGMPLFMVGAWGNCRHFGAGLTPIEDSTLLVYKVIDDHPLGIVPGDIILGYDGIPWKLLYQELLNSQLPLGGNWWGCSPSAYSHSFLMSCGMNWHLFDTIDIVQYATGDTLHYETSQLLGLNKTLWCSEQLSIPGVPMPDYYNEELFSYGIIDGTSIGYIYGWGWFWDAEEEFYDAVYAIMHDFETTGLIIDFRLNFGGNMFLSNDALSLLFNENVETIGFAWRSDTADHTAMIEGGTYTFRINGDTASFYDKPIAGLTGPGALSSGDQVALRMKFHPTAKFFGKSTTAAFNSPLVVDLGFSGWYARYADADAYLATESGHYITHDEFEVDEEVWHNPDDVAFGIDAVVQAAVEWIDSLTVSVDEINLINHKVNLSCSPNPFSDKLSIQLHLNKPSYCKLEIYDLYGKHVFTMFEGSIAEGYHKYNWDGSGLSNGIYNISLLTDDNLQSIKIMLLN